MNRIAAIVARLRGPDGCPWDRAQDAHSMKSYIIEEAYEVCEAIEAGDPKAIREELGDLLFQIVFQAQLAAEQGHYTLDDVVDSISDKMEERHPHVFGGEHAPDAETVQARWEQRKAKRRGTGLFSGLPKALPALHKARRIGEKAAAVGFEWPDISGVLEKLDEELGELREALSGGDRGEVRHELGDLLFVLVSLGRHVAVDAEDALRRTLDRFIRRFGHVERRLTEQGRTFDDADLDEMESLWQDAKRRGL